MKKNKELAILVYSCWKNSDMWPVFLQLFRKYWENCPYCLILLTDKIEGDIEGGFDDTVVLDSNWYDMLMAGIERADTEYVMLWMDDYLLCDYVQNRDVVYYLEIAKKYNAANVLLTENPFVSSKEFSKNRKLKLVSPGTAYSFSTQVGIWSAGFLKKYVKEEWSPWDFERRGSVEIKQNEYPILHSRWYSFPYVEGIHRGKWTEMGVWICKRNHIKINLNKRRKMNNFEMAWLYFKGGILKLNPTMITKIQNVVYKRKGKK